MKAVGKVKASSCTAVVRLANVLAADADGVPLRDTCFAQNSIRESVTTCLAVRGGKTKSFWAWNSFKMSVLDRPRRRRQFPATVAAFGQIKARVTIAARGWSWTPIPFSRSISLTTQRMSSMCIDGTPQFGRLRPANRVPALSTPYWASRPCSARFGRFRAESNRSLVCAARRTCENCASSRGGCGTMTVMNAARERILSRETNIVFGVDSSRLAGPVQGI